MHKIKKEQLTNLIVLVATVLIQIIIWKIRGNRGYVGVDSKRYIGLAHTLLEDGWICFFRSAETPFYFLYPMFLEVIFSIFGENYLIVTIFQVGIYAIACLGIYRILEKIKKSSILNMLLTISFGALFEVAHWNFILYSDSVALLWIVLDTYLYVCWIQENNNRKKNVVYIFLLAALGFTLLSRTNAFIFVGAMLLIIMTKLSKKAKIVIAALICVVIACVIVIGYLGYIDHYLQLTHRYVFDVIFERYKTGLYITNNDTVFWKIPEKHLGTAWTIIDVLLILGQRLCLYWSVWQDGFSKAHILFNFVQLVPLYLLALYSIVIILKNKRKEYYFILFIIFMYDLGQSIMWMDVEFRYRIPAFIFVVLICQPGLINLKEKILQRRGKHNEANYPDSVLQ